VFGLAQLNPCAESLLLMMSAPFHGELHTHDLRRCSKGFRGRVCRFVFQLASHPENGLGWLARRRARGMYSVAARIALAARYMDGGIWIWRQPCVICMPPCEQIRTLTHASMRTRTQHAQKNKNHTRLKEGERLFLAAEC